MTQDTIQIQYLQRHQLQVEKWDKCIREAGNGLIYAYSNYLDAMASGQWDALVWNDYEAVMPLPWRKKWGIQYLYQPFLTAQLGVFGNGLTPDLFFAFLRSVPKKFRFWELSLNHQNLYATEGFPLYQRMNYILPLNKPYELLQQVYRENIRRNIRKSHQYGTSITNDVTLEQVFELATFQSTGIDPKDAAAFQQLFVQLQQKGLAKIYGIISPKGDLLASAAFLFSHNRAYYILVGNHPNGRTLGASHALIDAFIRDHAGSNLLLDFEGSDIRNLAFFYSSFGAMEERYAAIRLNRLPFFLRWMKKGSIVSPLLS